MAQIENRRVQKRFRRRLMISTLPADCANQDFFHHFLSTSLPIPTTFAHYYSNRSCTAAQGQRHPSPTSLSFFGPSEKKDFFLRRCFFIARRSKWTSVGLRLSCSPQSLSPFSPISDLDPNINQKSHEVNINQYVGYAKFITIAHFILGTLAVDALEGVA